MESHKFNFIYFDEIDSTNNYLKNKYKELSNFTFLKTNYQTAGRGQFDRLWESNQNENLLFSILLKNYQLFQIEIIKKIIVDTLLELLLKYNINGRFKEPNDIYVFDKKILGILIETKVVNNKFDYIVIGIGLNVNQLLFSNNGISLKNINKINYEINVVYQEFVNLFKIKILEIESED